MKKNNPQKGFPRQNFLKEKLAGFTLVEILVVTSIIILLSALLFPNYRSGEKQFALSRSVYKLANDIRRAGEMAMSAKGLAGGGIPSGGYGIHFEKYSLGGTVNYYIYLYADTTSPTERYNSGDQIVETLSLEKEVKIKSVMVDGLSPDNISINFKPPDPIVRLRSDQSDYSQVIITLSLKDDESKTRVIRVNRLGLIDID